MCIRDSLLASATASIGWASSLDVFSAMCACMTMRSMMPPSGASVQQLQFGRKKKVSPNGVSTFPIAATSSTVARKVCRREPPASERQEQ
eukprot:5149507-Amphidinium_carterae.1